jgi:hypothetical protein
MKAKLTALLGRKGKGITLAASAALVLALGTITAYAANEGASLVRVQDGNVSYSGDAGQSRVNGAPAGFSSDHAPGAHPEGDGGTIMVRRDDEGIRYSTDNGATWHDGAPEGLHTETDANGGVYSWFGDRPEGGDGPVNTKNESGAPHYSYGSK